MHIGPSVPWTMKPEQLYPYYTLFIVLITVLTGQVIVLVKIENIYQRFLLGQNKRGQWANERLAILAWNDAIRAFCLKNDLDIILHKRISYPTTMADALMNYI